MSVQNPKSRKPLFLTLIFVGLFLAGIVIIPLLVSGQQTALESSNVIRPPVVLNQDAPQLALTDLQGNSVTLRDVHGKVVLINNWATWCPPCQSELPELQAYYQAHATQGFVIIAIESGQSADSVRNFVQTLNLTFPVWLDPSGTALDSFRNWDLPSSYVINQQGLVCMSWAGPVNRATLEKYINPLLEK